MFLNKDELIKEVFELEVFKKLKESFPNEDLENVVVETLSVAFADSGNADVSSSKKELIESQG